MGLFSHILHVYRRERSDVLRSLDLAMQESGFGPAILSSMPADGPAGLKRGSSTEAIYLISERVGDWLTVIPSDYVADAPDTAEVALRVSVSLETFTLSLIVHDDDVMFYNLFNRGLEVDGYNSCPQYFERDALPVEEIESQRHTPNAFVAVLPPNRSIKDVVGLLNRGWWSSYDEGKLDEYGVESEDSDGFANESDRMTEFGTLLALHGHAGEYPYAAWHDDPRIEWPTFQVAAYRRGV